MAATKKTITAKEKSRLVALEDEACLHREALKICEKEMEKILGNDEDTRDFVMGVVWDDEYTLEQILQRMGVEVRK
jgi:hypothetical protein